MHTDMHLYVCYLFIYLSLCIYVPKFKNALRVEEGAHIELWLHKYILCMWKSKDNLRVWFAATFHLLFETEFLAGVKLQHLGDVS